MVGQLVSALPAPHTCGTHVALLAASSTGATGSTGTKETGLVITCDELAVDRPNVNAAEVDGVPTFEVGTSGMCKVGLTGS